MYNWIEELDNDCGTETELDVIALCCEFTEYENLAEFCEAYESEDGSVVYDTIDDIANNTSIIMIDDESFIIQDF